MCPKFVSDAKLSPGVVGKELLEVFLWATAQIIFSTLVALTAATFRVAPGTPVSHQAGASEMSLLELTIVAPILENSAWYLVGMVVMRASTRKLTRLVFAGALSLAFTLIHMAGVGWVGIASAPFGILLSTAALGLFWNEKGYPWSYVKLLILHGSLNFLGFILAHSLEYSNERAISSLKYNTLQPMQGA